MEIANVDVASVLIVEGISDARDVLCTSLERRGLRTFVSATPDEGLSLARRHHPDVIVFDADVASSDDELLDRRLERESWEGASDLVILGRMSYPPGIPRDQIIAKPYHFAPLIHKIEQIVDRRRQAAARKAA